MKKMYAFGKEYCIYDLEKSLGIKNPVFDIITAVEFIIDAANSGERILGGDILKKVNRDYVFTYDNWYSDSPDVLETRDTAINYLRTYLNKVPMVDWIVSLTTSNH